MEARQKTRQVMVGNVPVGGDAPVAVQSMLNAPAADVEANLRQIEALADAGCEIVRMAIPQRSCLGAFEAVCAASPLPVVADVHFDAQIAIEAARRGAAKLRINPGNIGGWGPTDEVIEAARAAGIPIRVGVNGGSLEKELLDKYGGPTPEAMVESALGHIRLLELYGFENICVSLKASSVPATMGAYRLMAERYDYPLHLGVTEAGTRDIGELKAAAGIGGLLGLGIGDTLRVSLTADPVEEVYAARRILKAVGLRREGPELIACPTCGRTQIDLIPMAERVEELLKGVDKPITVAVMGCVGNGPGEARHADVGIAGGKGEGVLFKHGEIVARVPEEELVPGLMKLIGEL